jgi:hypothetical protein
LDYCLGSFCSHPLHITKTYVSSLMIIRLITDLPLFRLTLVDPNKIEFPSNSNLNFNYVEFKEAFGENWRYPPYFNGTCDGIWEIHPKYVLRDAN